MNKEFIQYTEALELKELGFDEPCFRFYSERYTIDSKTGGDIKMGEFYLTDTPRQKTIRCKAPTFSQAFRWFREKYRLHNYIYKNVSGVDFWGYYTWETGATSPYDSYEEAELACLRKLIEIVKEKL